MCPMSSRALKWRYCKSQHAAASRASAGNRRAAGLGIGSTQDGEPWRCAGAVSPGCAPLRGYPSDCELLRARSRGGRFAAFTTTTGARPSQTGSGAQEYLTVRAAEPLVGPLRDARWELEMGRCQGG